MSDNSSASAVTTLYLSNKYFAGKKIIDALPYWKF